MTPPTPAAPQPQREHEEYLESCKNGLSKCPPQCMTSSGCPNLNLQEYDGEPETYPQDTFCKCPYRQSRPHTPAPETISKELALELCMDARKEAAQAAREQFIKHQRKIEDKIVHHSMGLSDEQFRRIDTIFSESVKSLRAQKQGGVSE